MYLQSAPPMIQSISDDPELLGGNENQTSAGFLSRNHAADKSLLQGKWVSIRWSKFLNVGSRLATHYFSATNNRSQLSIEDFCHVKT